MKKAFNQFSKIFIMLWLLFLEVGSMYGVSYVQKSFSDLTTNDVVIITMTNTSGVYAASNNNGASQAPSAVSVTVANNIIETDATNIIWTVDKDGDNISFKVGNNKLYCTNTNNGVRVGTNANNVFSIDATSGYLYNNGTSRFIGVYNNSDWRCYTSVNNNIKNQVLAFYVCNEEVPEPEVPDTIILSDTLTCATAKEITLSDSIVNHVIYATIKGYVTDTIVNKSGIHYFWMADSVNGGHVFEAYNVTQNPNIGDLVWIKGKLTNYNNNTAEIIEPELGILKVNTPSQDTIPQDTIDPVDPDTTVIENIMLPGENASVATVNDKPAVKVGTSKNAGTMTITVPSDAITLVFYAAAWKGNGNPELTITPEDKIGPNSIELTANDGISNNSPFTLSGNENDFKFEFDLLNLTEETVFTLTSSKRFVVWNASYEIKQITTDFETLQNKTNAYKVLNNNGEIQIHRDNKIYNIYGNLVR